MSFATARSFGNLSQETARPEPVLPRYNSHGTPLKGAAAIRSRDACLVVRNACAKGRENGWLPHLTLSSRIYELLHMPKRIPYLATCRRFKVLMAVLAIGSDVSAKRPRQAVVPAASSQGRWTDGSFRSGTQWLSLALTHITYNIHTYPHTNGLITTRPRYIPKQSSAHSVQVALLD